MADNPPAEPAADYVTDIGLRKIDHVGIAVADLDAAIEFYRRTFGMECVHIETNTEQGVKEAMLAVGPDDGTGYVQLLAPLYPDSTISRFLDRHGPGVQQVAYTVADIDAACTALRARGLRLVYDTPQRGTFNSRVNFVHPKDVGGVLVELVEPAAEPAGPITAPTATAATPTGNVAEPTGPAAEPA
jgi:methylmalonyl-CoA/ethylmalonyl-CoA epimerase